jgi:hypothetical protein
MTRWALAAGLALYGAGADAHHSLHGVYDTGREVTVEGVIAAFHFVNPHPYLLVDARDRQGRAQQWRMEMDNRRELVDVGMSEQTLNPGDRVTATGSPGRSTQITSLYIRRLDRPADGFRYEQLGYSPRITKIPR